MLNKTDVLSAEQAYAIGIDQRRMKVTLLGVCGAIGLALGAWSIISNPPYNTVDAAILALMTAAYVSLALLLLIFPAKTLHTVLLGWVITAAVGFTALVLNAYFGVEGKRILQDRIPLFTGWTPAVIIFAFTYLRAITAQMISAVFCFVTGLASILFLAINYPAGEGESLIGAMYLLMQFALLNPMCVVLLSLLLRLYAEVITMMHDADATAKREKQLAEHAQLTDEVTNTLNRKGIEAQLQLEIERIADDKLIIVTAVSINDHQKTIDQLGEEKGDSLLREMTAILKDGLGPNTRVGRREGSHFILWSVPQLLTDPEAIVKNLHKTLNEWHPESADVKLKINLGATVNKMGVKAFYALEQANFNLFLARTRGTGMVFSLL